MTTVPGPGAPQGPLQPKGELDGTLLPTGAKVGDVLRAEADFTVDGITVVSVLPPKSARVEPERIELRPAEREFQPVVTTLAARTERRGRPDRGPRDGDRPDRARRDRPRTDGPRPDNGRPGRGPGRPSSDRRSEPARWRSAGPAAAPREQRRRPPAPTGAARAPASQAEGEEAPPRTRQPRRVAGHPSPRAAPDRRAALPGWHTGRADGHQRAERHRQGGGPARDPGGHRPCPG